MQAKRVLLALGLGGVFTSVAMADVAFPTVVVGGPGGVNYDAQCKLGWLKGLGLRTGKYVDQVAPQCVDESGERPEPMNVAFGGTGGIAATTTCQSGFVVKGLRGGAGKLVDRVQLRCVRTVDVMQPDEPDGTTERIDDNYPAFGGNGGAFYSIGCANGDGAVGITGAAGKFVDRIGLYCKDTPF